MYAAWNLGVTSASLSPKPGMLAVSYWAPAAGAGGNGTWLADSNTFWAPNSDGSGTKELWGNGTAVFGGTAGTVTPSGAVLAGSLSFTRTGYTLATSGTTGSTIQLVGSAPAIQLASGIAATINTNLVASGVLAITGTGTRGTATLGGVITAADTILQGGFFTDADGDFLSLIDNATWDNAGFTVYVLGDGQGTDNRLNGQGYYNWRNPAMFGWTQSLFASTEVVSANFTGGTETGRVLQLVVGVPEPSTYAMALAGLACGGFSMWRRQKPNAVRHDAMVQEGASS